MTAPYDIEILCPKCKQPMVRADNVSPEDQIGSGDYERPCRKCEVGDIVAETLMRDHRAQAYLNKQMVKRFQESRRERFRRFVHNSFHSVAGQIGMARCQFCKRLTRNRLEPKPLEFARPMSFANRRGAR